MLGTDGFQVDVQLAQGERTNELSFSGSWISQVLDWIQVQLFVEPVGRQSSRVQGSMWFFFKARVVLSSSSPVVGVFNLTEAADGFVTVGWISGLTPGK